MTEGSNQPATASIELSVYEWHILLDELQERMRVVNVDTTNTKFLWEKISNKLNGTYTEPDIVSD